MAFTPYPYQPNYFGTPYGYQQPQQQMIQTQQAQRPPIQQGLVLIPSENDARAYPVAPGNTITFKDETRPYCYVKSMGFNQFDQPTFKRYRLVEEDAPQNTINNGQPDSIPDVEYALKSDVDAIKDELEVIKAKINMREGVENDS